jgi:hypothetical protein
MNTRINSRLHIKKNSDGTFDLIEQDGTVYESNFPTYSHAEEARDLVNHDRDRDAGMLRWTQSGQIMGFED